MQFATILSGLGPVIRALIPIPKGLRSKVVGILADKPTTADLREVVDVVAVWGFAAKIWSCVSS